MKNQTLPLPPGVPPEFVARFGPHIKFALCGWDRLVLRGSLRSLFSPRRARGYLCAAGVLLKDFRDWAQAFTARIKDTAIAAARTAGRPYQFLYSSETDKLALAREIAERDRVRKGLVCVFSALEPCTAVTVRGERESGRLVPVVERRKCLHLYPYVQHPIFGLCHVRVQTWLPFTVDVWINGREWLARQMDAAGLAYVQRGNFFSALADPAAAQALFERQQRIDWPKLLAGLLDQAHKGEAMSIYQARPEGVRIKHLVGHNGIKGYDKNGQGLRVETTLNAPEVFKIRRRKTGRKRSAKAWRRLRRSIADAPLRAEISRAANARYLQALAATAAGRPLGETATPLTERVRWKGRRYRGLNPFAAADAAVLALINRGEFTVEGFRNADVQGVLFTGRARTQRARKRRSAAASRWLRLLRAHRLIRKVPGRHRYVVTARGREAATAVITAQHADVAKLTALAA